MIHAGSNVPALGLPTPVPMRFADCPLLWSVDEALPANTCLQLVREIEAAKPALATNNPLFRNQDRVIRNDPALAAVLLERIRSSLPERIGALRLQRVNELLRLYRYKPGQRFEAHTDHWYQPDKRSISLLTVLVYLNEGFTGGHTRFMEQLDADVVPKMGQAAIFQHKVTHEGCEVTSGTKYALRTDVIYEADSDIVLRPTASAV